MTGLYRVGTKVTLPAKIRKMSKRRQKIALIRRLRKELEGFVGRKYDDDLVDSLSSATRKWIDKTFPEEFIVADITEEYYGS